MFAIVNLYAIIEKSGEKPFGGKLIVSRMESVRGIDMISKVANIIRIEEPDFGCEGRQENEEVISKILLETLEDQEQVVLDVAEKCLCQMGLDEGMKVNLLINDDGTAMIQK